MRDRAAAWQMAGFTVLIRRFLPFCLLLLSTPALSDGARDLERALRESVEEVRALATDVLARRNQSISLLSKLEAVAAMVSSGACDDARRKVRTAILPKLDRCAASGGTGNADLVAKCAAQSLLHALLAALDEQIRLWCDPGLPFDEGYTSRDVVNLRIDNLTVTPDRAMPGDVVTIDVTVANVGGVTATGSSLRVAIDDASLSSDTLPAIAPGAVTSITFHEYVQVPGRHWVVAEAGPGAPDVERDRGDNVARALLRVGGEPNPVPEVEVQRPDFEALNLNPGASAVLPITLRNAGFAPVDNVPVGFTIDGVSVSPLWGGGDVMRVPVLNLTPGAEATFQVPWSDPTPGQHIVGAVVGLAERLPDPQPYTVTTWNVLVPGLAFFCPTDPLDRWTSIGPRLIVHGSDGAPSGSTGRMDRIAFHPTDADTLYAAAPTGGVWKTTNGGGSWSPVGDGLPVLSARGLAVDPGKPSVVYVALIENHSRRTDGKGIFKSLDGGATWHPFAAHGDVGDVQELFVRRSGAHVVVYAAGASGVRRYMSLDPDALRTASSEWTTIKNGKVQDLTVHPSNPDILYVSVTGGSPGGGVFRTNRATTPSGAPAWQRVGPDIFAVKPPKLDLFAGDPRQVYAAVMEPFGEAGGIEQKPWLVVYRSENEGADWTELKREGIDGRNDYNDFIRVDPQDRNAIYFGGVKLYKDPDVTAAGAPFRVAGVHDDMKQLEFDPHDFSRYYLLSDGGVFLCQRAGTGQDTCGHRNTDLRTVQFYDIDVARNNAYFMIGGTQDNGTIKYSGWPDWESINGGDGLFSLIGSVSDRLVLYSQHQRLRDTERCDRGDECWWQDWTYANGRDPDDDVSQGNELPRGNQWSWEDAFITLHPANPDLVLSQGPEVFASFDGGMNWHPQGPTGTIDGVAVTGHITRVAIQPGSNRWIAGTSEGQLWYTSEPGTWRLLHQHPSPSARPRVLNMAFAPADSNVLYVIFDLGKSADPARIVRLSLNLDEAGQPTVAAYMGGLPQNLIPRTVAGDGWRSDRAYVGTHEGGVFRWDATQPYWQQWTSYNRCLPHSVDVQELLTDPTSKELRAATWGRGAWSAVTGP